MNIVLVNGGFDPLHSGHIAYFKAAKMIGDMLIVGLNSDEWLERKKGRSFMPWNERLCLINNLLMVDEVYTFDDEDGSARHFIQQVRAHYPNDKIIFANGGDRTEHNIPEMDVVDSNIEFVFGVGGADKKNSSSWILEDWKNPKTIRTWGYYRVLHDVQGTKVKELTVMPGQSLSLQRHQYRQEFWHVTSGRCLVEQRMPGGYALPTIELTPHKQLVIPKNDWHRIYNPFDEPCKIVEVQYGDKCEEEDIERL
jgi:cytidyltransferase-like protein